MEQRHPVEHKRSKPFSRRWWMLLAGVMWVALSLAACQGQATPPSIPTATVPPTGTLPPTNTPPTLASIALLPNSGYANTEVAVWGVAWPANTTVFIHLESLDGAIRSDAAYAAAVTDGRGQFQMAFLFPEESLWLGERSVRVVARAPLEGIQAMAAFEVRAPQATATLSPTETPLASPTAIPGQTATQAATVAPTRVIPTATRQPTVVPTVTSPAITHWRGEYFSNRDLIGSPALVRNDQNVDFNWGQGAPVVGLPADRFSARWTRTLGFSAGTYRFWVRADDGVRLWVDSQLILDQWREQAATTFYADLNLTQGDHAVRLEYFDNGGQALVQLWWERLNVYPDWKGQYFSNPNLQGAPVVERNDAAIDFNWGGGPPAPGVPGHDFSARWTRTLPFQAGTYRFFVRVDDGVRLWVDNSLVIDQWRLTAATEYTADINLVAGNHTVRVEYFNHLGESLIRLRWELRESYPDWKGRYFNNRHLEGDPVLIRNDQNVDFNWGTGSPAAAIPADNFSVRWTRTLDFTAGIYRFFIRADDGVRFYLDNAIVMDEWHDANSNIYQADRTLAAGSHQLEIRYYEHMGNARVEFWWQRLTATTTPVPPPTVQPPPPIATATRTATATPTATLTLPPTPSATPVLGKTATFTPTPIPPTHTPTPAPATTTPIPPPTATPTLKPSPVGRPTDTPVPPTETSRPTDTPVPPTLTATPLPPTATSVPPTATLVPPTTTPTRPAPTLILIPTSGGPGTVVKASGANWPASTVVRLLIVERGGKIQQGYEVTRTLTSLSGILATQFAIPTPRRNSGDIEALYPWEMPRVGHFAFPDEGGRPRSRGLVDIVAITLDGRVEVRAPFTITAPGPDQEGNAQNSAP